MTTFEIGDKITVIDGFYEDKSGTITYISAENYYIKIKGYEGYKALRICVAHSYIVYAGTPKDRIKKEMKNRLEIKL